MTHKATKALTIAASYMIEANEVIGLGSGSTINTLIDELANRHGKDLKIRAVVASTQTEAKCLAAGIQVIPVEQLNKIPRMFDSADEVDRGLYLIKGKGGALLREKLLFSMSLETTILAQEDKMSASVGDKSLLPVEIVRFNHNKTLIRLASLAGDATLRLDAAGQPFVTDEQNFIADIPVPTKIPVERFADSVKLTTGVIEHGFFFDMTDRLLIGKNSGTVTSKIRYL